VRELKSALTMALNLPQLDLPLRLQKNIPLTPSNRDTYYLRGNHTPYGYTDYPFADEDVDGVQSNL
jgi:hypothetical protein